MNTEARELEMHRREQRASRQARFAVGCRLGGILSSPRIKYHRKDQHSKQRNRASDTSRCCRACAQRRPRSQAACTDNRRTAQRDKVQTQIKRENKRKTSRQRQRTKSTYTPCRRLCMLIVASMVTTSAARLDFLSPLAMMDNEKRSEKRRSERCWACHAGVEAAAKAAMQRERSLEGQKIWEFCLENR